MTTTGRYRQVAAAASVLFATVLAAGNAGAAFLRERVVGPVNIPGWDFAAKLDQRGTSYIAYYDATKGDLLCASRALCGGWVVETVDSTDDVGGQASLAIDAQGNPHIGYVDWTNGRLKYAHRESSGWMTEVVDSSGGLRPSIAIDAEGMPHISYVTFDVHPMLMYAHKIGSGWSREVVDGTASSGSTTSLALDVFGSPRIAYNGRNNSELRYAAPYFGTWLIANPDSLTVLGPVSLAVDAASFPHITARSDKAPFELVYATNASSNPGVYDWTSQTVDFQGCGASIATDGSNVPHISYYNYNTGELRYASRSAGVWTSGPIDSVGGDAGSYTFLVLDGQGNPRISYYDETTFGLKYASVTTPRTCDVVSTAPRSWASISFPLTASVASLTATLIPQLGQQSETTWRLCHWQPQNNSYGAAGAGLDSLNVAAGYWLVTRDPRVITVTGLPEASDPLTIPLENGPGGTPGWNQLANPYLTDVPISDISVKSDASGTVWPITSTSNTVTYDKIWVWDSSQQNYAQGTSVPAFSAFWVKKIDVGSGHLFISRPQAAMASSSVTPPTSPRVSAVGFAEEFGLGELRLSASQGTWRSNSLTFGVSAPGSSQQRVVRDPLPPSPPGQGLRLAIPVNDLGRMNGDYLSEYRPQADDMNWDFTLAGGNVPGSVTLHVDARGITNDRTIRLSDSETGAGWDLESGTAISLATASAPRRFRISWGQRAGLGAAQTPVTFRVYPNPVRGLTGLAFRIPREGNLSASIYDVQGRLVRQLQRTMAPRGENVLVWDGRDGTGRRLAAGLYLAHFQYGTESATRRIILVR